METTTNELDQHLSMTELACVGGHFNGQLVEYRVRGGAASASLASRRCFGLGRRFLRKVRRAAAGSLGRSCFGTPSLQCVSKLLTGERPPVTIIANADVLIG